MAIALGDESEWRACVVTDSAVSLPEGGGCCLGAPFWAHRVQGHVPKTTQVCCTCSCLAPLEGFNRPAWVPGHIPKATGDLPWALRQASFRGGMIRAEASGTRGRASKRKTEKEGQTHRGLGGSAGRNGQEGGGSHPLAQRILLPTYLTGDPSRSPKHPASVPSPEVSTGVPVGGPETQEGTPTQAFAPQAMGGVGVRS